MTDNRSVTRFFQTKAILHPPTLWNACDYVLQFNFHIMHVARTQNNAADFLSRIDLNPKKSRAKGQTLHHDPTNTSQSTINRRRRRRATFLPSRRNDFNRRRDPKRTSKTKCAPRRDGKHKNGYQRNNPNFNKQGIIHLCGNQRRRTYQSRTRYRFGLQSNQKEIDM